VGPTGGDPPLTKTVPWENYYSHKLVLQSARKEGRGSYTPALVKVLAARALRR
jgi:hypothetical protein